MSVPSLHREAPLPASLTPDVHLRHGLDGRWIAASESAEPVLGYRAQELAGAVALELVHPADRERADRALRAGLEVSDTMSLRLRLVRRDGTVLRADVRFDAVRGPGGEVTEHAVVIQDATNRQSADALRAQWEVLFRVTRRGIVVCDPRTKVLVAVNPAYAAMHGGTVEDFTGLPLACLLTPESALRIDALADEIDAAGFLSYESEHVRTDGSTFPVAIEVMAARDEQGEQLYWLTWVEDLTERRRAEAAAARHAEEMARSHAELDRFAGTISHDLQSPMRVIAGCARILERRAGDKLGEDDRELLQHIAGGVHRMTALLDGIREWSRARGDDAPVDDVDARTLVFEVLSLLSADLEAAGAVVEVGELPVLRAHRAALVQLFQNLIANAVKFRGDAPPRIRVEAAAAADGMWELAVVDNGIGIDAAYADRVFDFGQRLHADDEIPGSGIGLTVCQTVVERHGGRIRVEPAPGGGSAFRFTLPASSRS